jgi:DNA-binding transcriptional MerR regulator
MKKALPQISLDFGPEYAPPPVGEETVEPAEAVDPLIRQYMAAGVGVRVKSLKTAKTVDNGNLFEAVAGQPAEEPVTVEKPFQVEEPAMVEKSLEVEEPVTVEEPVQVEDVVAVPAADEEAPPTRTYRKKEAVTVPARRTTPPKASKSKRGRKSLKQITAEADLIEIPADEVLFSKQYYTMGEVSEMFKVNQSLLRFWETEFDILQPRKNKKGDRYFRPVDIKNLHLIYHLLRQRKYTIEGAREFLKKNKKAEERFDAIQRLQEIKAFLQEWKAQINFEK